LRDAARVLVVGHTVAAGYAYACCRIGERSCAFMRKHSTVRGWLAPQGSEVSERCHNETGVKTRGITDVLGCHGDRRGVCILLASFEDEVDW
jgi:hypothetical protein